ncbi:MAG: DUF885 domain-containing protein [Burkholderiales bacterium]
MLRLLRILLVFALVAASGLPVQAGEQPAEEVSRRLNQVFLDYAVASRSLFPLFATTNGWRAYDGQFANDLTEEHREAQRKWCRGAFERLQEFDRGKLNENDRLSYDVFRYNQQRCLERLSFDLHLLPVDQGGFNLIATFPVWGSGRGAHPFRNVTDYENFLKRISGFAEWMDTAVANMRRGMERSYVQPREVMQAVLPQLAAMIVKDAKLSPFYEPIASMPEAIGDADRQRLAAAYEAAIRTQIVPAYRRMHDFVRDEYLPRCRTTAGLHGLPGGDKLYAYYIRLQTTTAHTPDDIFELGQREMARARQRMEGLKKAAGYEGDLKAWAAQLRKGQQRYKTADDVISAYQALHERVYPRLGKVFGRLPKASYEIRRVETHREEGTVSQYWTAGPGRPAIFYVNLRALSRGSVGVSDMLFLHETYPGHHLQMAIARENPGLPGFRRVGHVHAFVEGWAVYAESLGFDLGLYADHYQHLVLLNTDLVRSARLVTDVGLHVRGWSRAEAIKFLSENTLDPDLFPDFERGVASSVERQMAWPASALGYKVGQLKMLELRARAEGKLGPKFDVRAFHDELLKDGALPLDILEAKMDRWITSRIEPVTK